MRAFRLVVAYEGTRYAGWQVQPDRPTVQGEIEAVLARITRAPCRLRAAGRTDAGVHAEGQVAVFRSGTRLDCGALERGLNALLPADIAVRALTPAPAAYDPRHHNAGKHYRYSVWNQPRPSPALAARALHLRRPLRLAAMAAAARHLVGRHDFAAFRAADCERETTVRTLYRVSLAARGPLVHVDVEGTAFLKHMVRVIAGTLLDVGRGRTPPARVAEILAGRDRTLAGPTAPPHGLCLVRVHERPPPSSGAAPPPPAPAV